MATVVDGSAGITTNAGGSVNPSTDVTGINYSCRAWVNFDGTRDSSGATSSANTNRFIRGSGNVTSVLKNSSGNYTVTFTNAMSDGNYCAVINGKNSTVSGANADCYSVYGFNTTTLGVDTNNTAGTRIDPPLVCIAIYR